MFNFRDVGIIQLEIIVIGAKKALSEMLQTENVLLSPMVMKIFHVNVIKPVVFLQVSYVYIMIHVYRFEL